MEVQQRSERSVTPLPDDVIMDILTRMPAHDVLKCRGVCRKWRALISTQHFQEMHLKAKACHSLMIVVQKSYTYEGRNELLLLDKWEQPRMRPAIFRDRAYLIDNSMSTQLRLSYDGLITFQNVSSGFTILNPISGDIVRVDMAKPGFEAFGLYLNPLTKEYCILLRTNGLGAEFQILNLGAQPCCRELKQHASFRHKPRNSWYSPPVVIDDATIYWLVEYFDDILLSFEELIMAFDIKTELFTFLPHPYPTNNGHLFRRSDTYIINIDGRLSFVQCEIRHRKRSLVVNIWALKDTAVTLWIKTHNFSIDIDRFDISKLSSFSNFKIMVLGMGELLLNYSDLEGTRIYAYSLELGTLRKIVKTNMISNFCIYVPSFVCLRDCKPKICI